MAEPGGVDGSGIDDVVLDDAFVRGATISELDAKRRSKLKAKEQAKADKRERRLYARHARRRRIRRTLQAVLLLGGVLGVAAAAGASGQGPLSFLQGDDAAVDAIDLVSGESTSTDVPPLDPAASTSTTEVSLEARSYDVGDCVLWDQRANRFGDARHVEVVDCGRPHVLEVTGTFELPRGPYPSEGEWRAIFDTGRCAALGAKHLGGPLDPYGRYTPQGIIPQEDGWRLGDRQVWCGLGHVPLEEARLQDEADQLFAGVIDPKAQHRIYPVGSCLGPDGEGWTYGTVPCDGPHLVEISGHVDLTGRADQFPSDDQYDRLVRDQCERQSKAYAGANLRDPVQHWFVPITQGSWDAGRRTVECTVGEYRNQELLTITRRLGTAPA